MRRRYHRKLVVHFIASSGATRVLVLRAPRSGRAPPQSCLPLLAISCSNQFILPWPIEGPTRPTPTNTLELIHWAVFHFLALGPRTERRERDDQARRPLRVQPAVSHPLALASVSASPTSCLDGAVRRNLVGIKTQTNSEPHSSSNFVISGELCQSPICLCDVQRLAFILGT